MSEIVENVNEQNSAQNNEEAALPTEAVVDVIPNNVDAAVKAVPEAVIENANALEKASASPKVDNKKTPAKRTPSKRMSFIERAQKESEELVKNMGGSLEIEGGRKTRSSTRGSATSSPAVSTPPPAKKARASPASGTSTPTRPRGRGRKLDVADDATEEEENKATPAKKKSPAKGKKDAAHEADHNEDVTEEKPEEVKDDEKKKPVEEKQEAQQAAAGLTESKVVAADENKETPAVVVCEQTKDEIPKEEDKTDAVVLDPVVEETESQVLLAVDSQPTEKNVTKQPEPENKSITAEVVLEITESANSNSPMDTDIIEIVEEKCQDKQEVPKPTSEPMEIDSSPENDVVEIIEDPDVIVAQPAKSSESEQSTTAHNNIANTGEASIKHSLVPPADIVANNSLEKSAAVADLANANEANNATNKAANDLCEPKIATSPPISASSENSNVTTPQTCN